MEAGEKIWGSWGLVRRVLEVYPAVDDLLRKECKVEVHRVLYDVHGHRGGPGARIGHISIRGRAWLRWVWGTALVMVEEASSIDKKESIGQSIRRSLHEGYVSIALATGQEILVEIVFSPQRNTWSVTFGPYAPTALVDAYPEIVQTGMTKEVQAHNLIRSLATVFKEGDF